jgi:hypothetical protein
MDYSRRNFVRDVTRVSVGLAAGSSLPFLTGCERKIWGSKNPACFQPGIRIFFIGAWLFCKDSIVDPGLLAIAQDMPGLGHSFPYGIWPGPQGMDNNPSLGENPTSGIHVARNAYPVSLLSFQSPYKSVKALFAGGCTKYFQYFENVNGDLTPTFNKPGIRVISFPLPTRVIAADLLRGSYVSDKDQNHKIKSTDNSGTFATAHIFEYEGASLLTFNGQPMVAHGTRDSLSNFHFHTVPPPYAPPDHASRMFKNLISVIAPLNTDDFSLTVPDPDRPPEAGEFIPNCVEPEELTLPPNAKKEERTEGYHFPFHHTTASCAAASVSISG